MHGGDFCSIPAKESFVCIIFQGTCFLGHNKPTELNVAFHCKIGCNTLRNEQCCCF